MSLQTGQRRDDPSDDLLEEILGAIAEGREFGTTNGTQIQPERRKQVEPDVSDELGIDKEIVVIKKRIPIPKLNDERLLSDPGIPRLRKISKERLRFKGKGHEYGDIARMLNMYQLWLDDLYPRAKFADALTIIEKVGHSRRMQTMRKDWMDEGKPRRSTEHEDPPDVDDVLPDATNTREAKQLEPPNGVRVTTDQIPDSRESTTPVQSADGAKDGPAEDELDALLAEDTAAYTATMHILPSRPSFIEDDQFADDMEAIAEMDNMW